MLALLAFAISLAAPSAFANGLKPGEILITVGGTPEATPAVVAVDPETGAQRVVSGGGELRSPVGVALTSGGRIVVADPAAGAVIAIDPADGSQRVFAGGGLISRPTGVTVESTETILVADADGRVVRINLVTAHQSLVSEGGVLVRPWGITVAGGSILVTDLDRNSLVRVDPESGAQTVVTSGGMLRAPTGVTNGPDDTALVTAIDGNVIAIRLADGQQSRFSGFLGTPLGVALDADGMAVVVDNRAHAVIRITGPGANDPITSRTIIASGSSIAAPRGIVIVPQRCEGEFGSLIGTPDGEKMRGSRRPDVIVPGRGPDRVHGGGGDDWICGGKGRDRLAGDGGEDRLGGGGGADVLLGGAGADVLQGGAGADVLRGGRGQDRMPGVTPKDRVPGRSS